MRTRFFDGVITRIVAGPERLEQMVLLTGTPAPRSTHRPVGIDLAGDWVAALTAAGLDQAQSTIWLAKDHHPRGARRRLLIDVIGKSMLDSAPMRSWLEDFARRGMPWRYGTDQRTSLAALPEFRTLTSFSRRR